MKLIILLCASAAWSQSLVGIVGDVYHAGGGITFSVAALHSNATATNSVSTSFLSPPTVGHAVYIAVWGNQGAGTFTFGTPSDNQGNSYSNIAKQDGIQSSAMIACGIATASSGTYTVTVTTSASTYLTLVIYDVAGGSCATDATDFRLGSASPISCYQSSGLTTTHIPGIVIAALTTSQTNSNAAYAAGTLGNTYTIPTNGAQQDGANFGSGASEYFITSATGTYTPQFSWTNGGAVQTCVAAAFF